MMHDRLTLPLRSGAALALFAVCAVSESRGRQPKELFSIKQGAGYVTFSPDGKYLAGKVRGKIWRATDVRIWEAATGKAVLTLKGHTGGIGQLSFSPDGMRLATHENYTAKVWDLKAKKEIRSIRMPVRTRSILFIDGAKRLATGHNDGQIRLWDVETARLERTLKGHQDWVVDLDLSPDGTRLASASIDLTAKVWDLKTAKVDFSLRGHKWYLSSVAFGPKGQRLITGSDDGTAGVWDLKTGRLQLTLRGHKDWVRDVAFSPDGKILATGGSDNTVKIWNAATGREVGVISAHTDKISCVTFSPDGSCLVTSSLDKTVRFWDVRSLLRK